MVVFDKLHLRYIGARMTNFVFLFRWILFCTYLTGINCDVVMQENASAAAAFPPRQLEYFTIQRPAAAVYTAAVTAAKPSGTATALSRCFPGS